MVNLIYCHLQTSIHRICLKYFHCDHRNHLYNLHIQSHYPESSPQGLKGLPQIWEWHWWQKLNFLISNWGSFWCHFDCFSLRGILAINIDARVSHVMVQFFLKIARVFFGGANATTEKWHLVMVSVPDMWLLVILGIILMLYSPHYLVNITFQGAAAKLSYLFSCLVCQFLTRFFDVHISKLY